MQQTAFICMLPSFITIFLTGATSGISPAGEVCLIRISCSRAYSQKAARRRRVPAFGEWNYYYYSGERATPAATAAAPEWCAAAPEMEASSDVWFKYSPPPRKPPAPRSRKARQGPPAERKAGGGKRATPARSSDSDAVAPSSSPARARARARAPAKASGGGVARRPVDADLYQAVPPPDFAPDYGGYEPRREWE
ncbi:hypothetical protein U9M48_038214 [Paspalum notatum var. saurae]|uniref:Uncharacterized protein n=1 Tax=Paspalum notatum var. saurae TaxID=547442 RepID=A0AAQ3XDB3_PASNO